MSLARYPALGTESFRGVVRCTAEQMERRMEICRGQPGVWEIYFLGKGIFQILVKRRQGHCRGGRTDPGILRKEVYQGEAQFPSVYQEICLAIQERNGAVVFWHVKRYPAFIGSPVPYAGHGGQWYRYARHGCHP